MMLSVKVFDLTAHNDIPLSTYHNRLAQMVCIPPQPRWYLGTCDLCPGTITLRDDLLTAMDNNVTDSIVFKQWVSVGRSTLETVTKPVYEFVKSLCEKLELFFTLFHSNAASLFLQGSQVSFTTWGFVSHCRIFRKLLLCPSRWSKRLPLEQLPGHLFVPFELCGNIWLAAAWYSCYPSVPKKADWLFEKKIVFKSSKHLLLFGWSSSTVQKLQEFHQLVPSSRRFWSACWMAFFSNFAWKRCLWWPWCHS